VASSDQALLSEGLAPPSPHSVTGERLSWRPFLTICHFILPNGKQVPKGRWKDNFKTDLQEVGWAGLLWLRIRTAGVLLWTR